MLTIVSENYILPQKREVFLSLVKELAKQSRQEKGCISYELHEDIKDTCHFCLLEVWENQAAIDQHNETAHFKTIVPQMRDCRAKQTQAVIFRSIDE